MTYPKDHFVPSIITSKGANNEKASQDITTIIKSTAKRWVILALFIINVGNKDFQWIQPSSATDKFALLYNVSNQAINATSVLFMLCYIIFCLPSCVLIERIGLRNAMLLGSGGTALGAIIKCFSCRSDMLGIAFLFLGQTCVSLSEQFMFSVASRLVSVWFPDHQVSSALAMTVLGNQVGFALGFKLTPMALEGAESAEDIGANLHTMFIMVAVFSMLAFVANLLLFDEAPKYAPGAARHAQMLVEAAQTREVACSLAGDFRELVHSVSRLLHNRDFVYLSAAYGINLGAGYCIHTLLNQMLAPLWPGDAALMGNAGFIIIMSGALSCPLWGWLLDRYRCYLRLNQITVLATLVSLVGFGYAASFMHCAAAIYVTTAAFGTFQVALEVAGLEMATEMMYPTQELITTTTIMITPQIFGTIFTFAASYLVDAYGAISANSFVAVCLGAALLILLNTREKLARQNACANANRQDIPDPPLKIEVHSVKI